MPGAAGSRALWFERLYAYLRLPFLAGALLFGAGLLAAMVLVVIVAGDLRDHEYLGVLIASISAYAVLGLFAQMAARAARRQVAERPIRPWMGWNPVCPPAMIASVIATSREQKG